MPLPHKEDTDQSEEPIAIVQRTKNGLVLEGYEKGGVVEIVQKSEVSFLRDICPYFASTFVIIMAHVSYYCTGNWMIPLFLANVKVISAHFFQGGESNQDKQNLSRKNERIFMKDWRFVIPLYTCHLAETLTWIWSLCLFSEDVKFESFYLTEVRPKTMPQLIIFGGLMGFIASMNVTAGHELIHSKNWWNKHLGMLVYTKYFYSIFMDEHVEGHHKYMATPEDPATSRYNEGVWSFMFREFRMSHATCWAREKRRIKKTYGEQVSALSVFCLNKVTH